jgi:cation diffusion facilitator family transporter
MPTPTRTNLFRRERWALRFSAAAGLALAGAATFVGPFAHSSAVLFDGLYGLLGVALSTFAASVSRTIEAGPTHKHPFGRDALTPLVLVIEALIMIVASVVAVVVSVLAIVHHSGGVPGYSATIYAACALVVSAAAWLLLRRVTTSVLVAAELWQWRASTVVSSILVAGFASASEFPKSSWAPDLDSLLIAVVSLCLLYPAFRLVRSTIRELTESRPESKIDERITSAVSAVARKEGLSLYEVRTAKTGKIYVEIEFVVPTTYTVAQADRVRKELARRLRFAGEVWLTAEFTAAPSFDTSLEDLGASRS